MISFVIICAIAFLLGFLCLHSMCVASARANREAERMYEEWKRSRRMKEADRFATDDVTWCLAECSTDCPRQPRYIRDNAIPHSFADFSGKCMAYTEKEKSR